MKKLERALLNSIIKRVKFLGNGNYLFSNNSGGSMGWTNASYSSYDTIHNKHDDERVGFHHERVYSSKELDMCIECGNLDEIIKYFKEKLGDIKINLVDELHKDTIGSFFSQNHP